VAAPIEDEGRKMNRKAKLTVTANTTVSPRFGALVPGGLL